MPITFFPALASPLRGLRIVAMSACWAGALAAGHASAAEYPSRPVTLVVPFAPGGNIDMTARVLAEPLGQILGQSVVVENRPGAGGMVGAAYVARSKPDGYTLVLGHNGNVTILPAVKSNVPYDPQKDFVALSGMTFTPSVFVTSSELPPMKFGELIEYTKKQDAGITMASAGVGSYNHLTIELLAYQTGLKATHVPYKGSAPAITDMLGGQVQAMSDQLLTSLPYIRDGKFHAVVQFGAKRAPLLPDVPTAIEEGYDGLTAGVFTGVFAPSGLPDNVRERLISALDQVRTDPAIQARYAEMGAETLAMNQVEFARFVEEDAAQWKRIAAEANISLD